jgi:diguanylate cyclase
MHMNTTAPATLAGICLGVIATTLTLPQVRAELWSALGSNPEAQLGILGVALIQLVLYALMRYEDRATRSPQVKGASHDPTIEVRAELERQFANFLNLVGEQLKSAERHSSALDVLNGRLDGTNSETEVRTIIEKLMASNEAYKREAVKLEHRLEKAQFQATQLKQRAARAERLASIDPLTNVSNRRKFDEDIAYQVALSHNEQTPLCLMMIDIDHFKIINDKYGHRAGDAVLMQFAELLTKMVRSTDIVSRYGGEEFAILLPLAPLGNAYEIAERIRVATQTRKWDHVEADVALTSSFGIADIRDGDTVVDLINRADEMLLEAKRRGRNRTMIMRSAA